MRSKWALGVAASALLATSMVALAAAPKATVQAASHPRTGGTLYVGIDSDFVTLDPAMSSALIDRQFYINVFDTLLKYNKNLQIEPNLVTRWKITNGGKTYTLWLRHGVQFQDGTPFNAQAIIYNWQWDMNPANASPRSTNLQLVQSLTAPNPYELIVQLKAPFTPFLSIMAGRVGMISSPTAMKKWGANYPMHPVGTGPFELVKWIKNDHLILKRNPHYWQKGLPYLNQIVYIPITNPIQEFQALETGEVNIIDGVAGQEMATLKRDSLLRYQQLSGLGYSDIELNTTKSPFTNVHNREALNYAINRQALIKLIYYGYAQPAYSQIPPSSWAFDPNLTLPFSDKLAEQQLQEAGNPKGFSFTILGDNDPVTMEMLQLIQSELAKVGIHMTIEPLDFTTLLTDAINGNFQADLLGWSGRIDPDQNMYAMDTTGGSFNDPRFSNSEVDQLLLAARESSSIAVRKADYQKAAALLLQQAPYIFLTYSPIVQAWQTKVKGFQEYPDGLLRFASVWLK
jgi:peptide/nickel transport system substrate-binding protein